MTREQMSTEAASTENLNLAASGVITLASSNLNLPPRIMAAGGVDAHWRVLDDIRGDDERPPYDAGYEITPTRALAWSMSRKSATLDRDEGFPFTSAVHQSWAKGVVDGGRQAWPSPHNMAFNLAAAGIMPEQHHSLQVIDRMSERLGGVPAVVFGDHVQPGTGDKLAYFFGYSFADVGAQISPEVWLANGGEESYSTYHVTQVSRGIDGIIVDTHHIQRSAVADDSRRLDVDAVFDGIEAEGTLLTRVHASAGRVDTRHDADKKRTLAELAALLKGPEALGRTSMGDILARSLAVWRSQRAEGMQPEGRRPYVGRAALLPVVVEVPYAGLVAHHEGPVDRTDFAAMHRTMTAHLREFLQTPQ